MLMCIQNLVKFCPFIFKIMSANKILTSMKGRNSVANLQNLTLHNSNLDIINVKGIGLQRISIISEESGWRD